jgi:hypothetical protein
MRTEFEYMGFLGLSWQEKLASDLYNLYSDESLKYTGFAVITHGSQWNTAYIDQMESAFKEGKQQGFTGEALAGYMRTVVQFDNPLMANSYVNLRDTAGGNMIENVVSSIVSPISKSVGTVVSNVASPLTKPIALIAVIGVVGLIAYTQLVKNKKSTKG